MTDELELPDGETVEIPHADAVMPTIAVLEDGTVKTDLRIQQDRLSMRERGEADLRVSTWSNQFDKREPCVSLMSSISFGLREDDIYTEIRLETFDEARELRDALTTILRYHGVDE